MVIPNCLLGGKTASKDEYRDSAAACVAAQHEKLQTKTQ
jgi:hypothetical protein